ncbi:MAG: alanine racemase [Candidatus Omnitrophica bacterium]|nr:alanine racemase [Candidatus Omnitrophota bacterium]
MPQKVTYYRPTWAEIDLDAIRYNFSQIKKSLSSGVKIMAVVKANAYGHGILEVSSALSGSGVDYLGVATMDEAVNLRRCSIKKPILVLGSILGHEIEAALKYDITLTACHHDLLKELDKRALNEGKKIKIHLKVDTGMGRIGVWHDEALNFIKWLSDSKNLFLEGIYTHFSSAGRDELFTNYQMESFERLLGQFEKEGIRIPLKHAANSIATIDLKRSHLNMVRPGIIIYGMYPKKGFAKFFKLKPALSLKTKIVYIKDLPQGRSISYGRTYIADKDTRIATLPIGYADGYERILSNKAYVLVKGKRARVVGKVTMDQVMIDVGHIRNAGIGDEVVLIGKQGRDRITTEELARLCGTIPYEIVCSIGSRVPRVYND